jgi:hypothetical protein
VLRPGGVLAALWNADDHGLEWVAELHRAARAAQPVPGIENGGVPPVFAAHDAFAPSESARFANPIRTGTEQLLATLATHSWALVRNGASGTLRSHRSGPIWRSGRRPRPGTSCSR